MQIKESLGWVWKQSNLLGRWWGNLQTIAQHTNIYIQFLILSFSATSAYSVLSTTMHTWGYQLPFWQFVLAVVLTLVLMAIFVWRLSIPSTFETWNEQFWSHGNKIRPKLEQMERDIAVMRKMLEDMKNERKE